MRKLIVYLEHATDGRIDRVEFDETVTLRDVDDGKRNRPFIAISRLAGAEYVDSDSDRMSPTIAALTRMFGDQLALSYLDGFTHGERYSEVVSEEDHARLVAELREYAEKLVRQTIAETLGGSP